MIEISKEQILEAMETASSQNKLAKQLGISKPTLVKFLTLYDLPTNLKRDNSITYLLSKKVSKEWLIENYINTPKSLGEIEAQLGFKPRELEKLCAYYQLKKPHKYTFDKEKFYNLKDPAIYYVAGLCATDGYVDADSNRISIGLINGDSEYKLLSDIKTYYGLQQEIEVYDKLTGQSVCQLTIADNDIKKFLLDNFNIPSGAKTWTVGVPQYFYNEDCKRAYVLGCFDGDGWITHVSTAPSVGLLSASREFAYGLSQIIYSSTLLNTHCCLYKSYYQLGIYRKNALTFLNWMYAYSGFKLIRKYNRYLKVKDIVCTTEQAK